MSGSFTRALELVSVLIMCALAVVAFGNVIMRYAADDDNFFPEEVSAYLFVWLIFLAAVLVYQEHSNFCMDFFAQKCGTFVRGCLSRLVNALILICCAVIVAGSWKLIIAQALTEVSVGAKISSAVFYFSGIAGGFALGVIAVVRIICGEGPKT